MEVKQAEAILRSPCSAYLLVRKSEFVYLFNSGSLRITRSRITKMESGLNRLFAAGLTASPTDADNCAVLGLSDSWLKSEKHALAVRGDLLWLNPSCVARIHPVKRVDELPLKELVRDSFHQLFGDPLEDAWVAWVERESVQIHSAVAQRLLKESGQTKISRTELESNEFDSLMRTFLGFSDSTESSRLVLRFVSQLALIAHQVGGARATLHAPFLAIRSWVSYRNGKLTESENAVIDRALQRIPRTLLSEDTLREHKVPSKIRTLERGHGAHFDKELRPLLMSSIIETNYRIAGEVFQYEDFARQLNMITKFEGRKSASVYTLYVACRIGSDFVAFEPTTDETQARNPSADTAIDSTLAADQEQMPIAQADLSTSSQQDFKASSSIDDV